MSQIQITLTPAESKRLIAKAVAALREVKNALKNGTIIIGVGTTNARVAEEILKRKVDRNRFAAGVILPSGPYVIPADKRLREIVVCKGKVIDARMDDVLNELTSGDVFIKGANAIDASGAAGVLLGSVSGGTVGKALGVIMARGVNLIIPVGLEKFVPGSVLEISKGIGISRVEYAMGCPLGMMPLSGKVVTELEAINILTGANAVVIGKGGVSGAEGSVTLSVMGTLAQLRAVKKLANGLKGEPGEKISAS